MKILKTILGKYLNSPPRSRELITCPDGSFDKFVNAYQSIMTGRPWAQIIVSPGMMVVILPYGTRSYKLLDE